MGKSFPDSVIILMVPTAGALTLLLYIIALDRNTMFSPLAELTGFDLKSWTFFFFFFKQQGLCYPCKHFQVYLSL